MKKYDTIIVGAGPAGTYAAYELMHLDPTRKVLLIEKGNDIYHRVCPIKLGKTTKCPKSGECAPACSITAGFGGAGAFSDGKFNITSEYGGWLTDYLDDEEVLDLIKYVDKINLENGAPDILVDPYTDKVKDIEKRGYGHGLKLLRSTIRHIGTEKNLEVQTSIYEGLKDKMDFLFKTECKDVIVEDGKVIGVKTANEDFYANEVILACGRNGSEWMEKVLTVHGVEFKNNQVDIGVRVETNNIIMQEINDNLYEGKFVFRTSVGTTVRTFCSNPSGYVVTENHNGAKLANGHAYSDEKLGSPNTNFALLVSHELEEPFNEPNEFAREICKLANKLGDGSVIVQKYGDILKGRRTTVKRLKEGFIKPTCKEAVPGDLGLVLPYNTMKSLIEMTEALNYVTPGIASEHTLFYGVEAKFYSARPKVDSSFMTSIKNLYVAGDGAGITRGLAQAGANGVKIAREIIKRAGKSTALWKAQAGVSLRSG